jgi:hypothetical protein
MGFGRFGVYLTSGWIDEVVAADKWLSLVAADPFTVGDPLTVEVVGGSLARQQGVWVRTSATLLTLDETVVFHGLPPGARVAGVAGFDDDVNGHLLFADLLDTPQDFPSGGTFVLPAGEYVLGIDVPGA